MNIETIPQPELPDHRTIASARVASLEALRESGIAKIGAAGMQHIQSEVQAGRGHETATTQIIQEHSPKKLINVTDMSGEMQPIVVSTGSAHDARH